MQSNWHINRLWLYENQGFFTRICDIFYFFSGNNDKNDSNSDETDKDAKSDDKEEENKSQPWYFHVVASVILVVHGLTFLGKSGND